MSALISITINPNNQPVTKDEIDEVINTFTFLCQKAGWSARLQVWPYTQYGGKYWRGMIVKNES